MTLGDFINTRCRNLLDDNQVPYLWSNEELLAYTNEALEIMCEEARVLEDFTTAAVCELSVVIGTATYSLHSAIVEVISVRWDTDKNFMEKYEKRDLDARETGWEATTNTSDDPWRYFIGRGGTITLTPMPSANGTAYLHVFRLPLAALTIAADGDVELPVRGIFQNKLVEFVLYRAYQKKDAETYNPTKSMEHFVKWERDLNKVKAENIRLQHAEQVVHPEDANL